MLEELQPGICSPPYKEIIMTSAEDYGAKAAEALVQLSEATNEGERTRLRRAHGAYLKLASHGAEAANRAAMAPPRKIKPEKPAEAKPGSPFRLS
jgi:hypothetical protein